MQRKLISSCYLLQNAPTIISYMLQLMEQEAQCFFFTTMKPRLDQWLRPSPSVHISNYPSLTVSQMVLVRLSQTLIKHHLKKRSLETWLQAWQPCLVWKWLCYVSVSAKKCFLFNYWLCPHTLHTVLQSNFALTSLYMSIVEAVWY